MGIIIPAIDLQNGEAVRLYKGDYAQKTVYSKNPADLAKKFEDMGAKVLHVVDLDGAKSGNIANLETIRKIRQSINIPIQVGGGIRNAETVAMYLNEIKIDRVILGTAAVENLAFVKAMLEKHGAEKIMVGVDVRDGFVSTSGWTQNSRLGYRPFIASLASLGVKYVIVTDISRDGTLTGPNWEMYKQISGVNVVVSGGIASDADIRTALGYYGVIVGKAFYENKVDLPALLCQKRIIPCLDIKNGRVVKGVNFEGLRDIGDPAEIALEYQTQGADEIVLLDITATTENRQTFCDIVAKVANAISIPITVGGGIRSINDIRRVLSAGASRVSLNSAAVKNPQLICDASTEFTSNKIIVAIDALGQDVYINGGMSKTDLNLIEWAQKCEQLGAGEILLTSISGDGMQTGYDIEMTRAVASAVNIPVIASGGCGEIAHIVDVFAKTNCAAALVASLVHTGKATIKQIKEALK